MADKIALAQAEFFFRAAPGEMPTEFVAANRQLRLAARARGEADFTAELPQSYGAHAAGWLEEPTYTPPGVFALAFLLKLPASQQSAILDGLHEIARVEGQEWAAAIVAVMEQAAAIKRGPA